MRRFFSSRVPRQVYICVDLLEPDVSPCFPHKDGAGVGWTLPRMDEDDRGGRRLKAE